MRTAKRIVHCIAQCQTHGCGWTADDYKKAARQAATHAKAHGHEVLIEQGITYRIKR